MKIWPEKKEERAMTHPSVFLRRPPSLCLALYSAGSAVSSCRNWLIYNS
jgi:hypothetical protein